jgi:hypothetical protein
MSSILAELDLLVEQTIETREAEELWSENETEAKTYASKALYLVKKSKTRGKATYDVFIEEGGKRTQFATLSHSELNDQFEPLRPDQTEDAEGFTKYREIGSVEAIKYPGPKVKINLSGAIEKLGKGDYLIRTDNDDEFIYSVEKARYFNKDYVAQD